METSNNIQKPVPILLIDDDGNIVNGISQIIEDAFPGIYQITKAFDGHQAVLQLEKQYFPIIISDIMMPNMDGLQLLELIKSHGIPSKVIMLSGYDDYAYVRKSMKTGAYDYLLKPVNINIMTELLKNVHSQLVNSTATLPVSCISALPDMPSKISYFDIPCDVPFSIESIQEHLEQIKVLLFRYETAEMERQIRKLFSGLSIEILSVSQWKSLLSNFLYDMMQKNEIMIRIVASYKLSDKDLSAQIKNQPTSSQLMIRMIEILKLYTSDLKRYQKAREDYLVKQAQKYISEHYADELALANIAEQSHFHPNYFSSLFKKKTGITIRDYILKTRIEKAKELMEDPEMKLIDIALAVGYQDQAHFNRAFKNFTGISPSQYRKQN